MPRQLSEILNHIRSVCANPSVDATLIQTEDLLELCKQAEKSTVEAPADVREVAEKLLEDWRHDLPSSFNDLVAAVASALTAQRAAGVEADDATVERVKAALQKTNMLYGPGRPLADNYADAMARAAIRAIRTK